MNKREYLTAVSRVNAERDERLAALAITWRLLHRTEPPAERPTASRGLAVQIAGVLAAMNGEEFTSSEVFAVVGGSRTAVTHALTRMASRKDAEIDIVRRGTGRLPTVFKKRAS